MSEPRLHFVHPGDLATLTGGYRYATELLAAMAAMGRQFETHRLSDRFPFPSAANVDDANAVLTAIPDGDVVVVDGLALGALPEVAQRHASRLRLVALVHHPLALESGLRPDQITALQTSERAALAAVDAVVVTSPATAAAVAAGYDVAASRVTIIEPGTRPSTWTAPPGPAPAVVRLLCVATLTPRKGHADLLEALALDCGAGVPGRPVRSTLPPWHLTCIGSTTRDPAHAARLLARAGDLCFVDRVSFVGERPPQDLDAAYESADIFVLPSYHEGYGMVLAEALAHGLPIVSTTAGAIPRTVPSGAGILVPPGNIDALHEALALVMANAPLRRRMSDAGRAAARRLPTWEQAARAMIGLVDRIVANSPGPAVAEPARSALR